MGTLWRGCATKKAHRHKSNKPETQNGTTEPLPNPAAKMSPQSKRSDAALKKAAVENWIKSGKPGTLIAAELGISYPSCS